MKKTLLLLAAGIGLSASSFAQVCTPDQSISETGIFPTYEQGFADAYEGTAYEQVLQIKVITDTTIAVPGFGTINGTVKHLVVDSVVGLPAGFSYECPTADCKILGGEVGCTKISGTAEAGASGTYPLKVYAKFIGVPTGTTNEIPLDYLIDGYSLEVKASENVSDVQLVSSKVFPNPAVESATVALTSKVSGKAVLSVVNILGEEVFNQNVALSLGQNNFELNASTIGKGVFFVRVQGVGKDSIQKVVFK